MTKTIHTLLIAALLFTLGEVHATTLGPINELTATPANVSQRKPAGAWDGTRYVLIWEDSRSPANGQELYLTRLDGDGTILDANGLPVLSPAQPGNQSQPSIAFSTSGASFILAWVDPRATFQDVYVSRFFPSGTGTFPEPGGIQITTGNDSETNPRVGCAAQSCMVSFQSSIVGGGLEARGVRLYPTGALIDASAQELVSSGGQTGELSPRLISLDSSFLLAWEDDRNNGMGNLGADLFIRSIPEIGTIPSSNGQSLVSQNLRQSSIEFSRFGNNEIIAAWQDQRLVSGTSTTVDLDVWYSRFSESTLSPVGNGPTALVAATRNQIYPDIAGGPNGAAVTWEDFRSGTYGLTYAAILDQNGNKKAPGDFPVFQFGSNMIEQRVVKGPGNDYLVMAVRALPSPARIYYRIIRDEPPAGTMPPSGTLQVPADGTSVAQVYFDNAVGASGFTVADGTMYTVTLSRNVTLTVTDADPALSGLQVVAGAGRVSFGMSTTTPGPVNIAISSVEGSATGAATVVFDNVMPEVSNVRIEPSQPRSDQDISLLYTYFDVNGDPEAQAQIQWTKNSAIQPAYANQNAVPANATSRGEIWRAQMRPFDGTDYGSFVFSNEVVVLNTAPSAEDVQILPDTDVRTNTLLRGVYRFVDSDSDAEMGTVLSWTLDGTEQMNLANASEVSASTVVKGQTWVFSVTPSDGSNPGPTVVSAPVTIVNSAPVAVSGAMGEVLERRSYSLDGSASSDIDPQDTLTYRWVQLRDEPRIELSDPTSSRPSFTAPSVTGTQILEFGLTVNDGEVDSEQSTVIVLIRPVPDSDADGLDDEEEEVYGTDPARGDTDRDGLSDGIEVQYNTSPLDEDSDDDGVRDGAEEMSTMDTDEDGLINALDADSDNDKILDGTELGVTSPLTGTSTGMGNFVPDADRTTTTNALVADTDGDGLDDGIEDANQNGRIDSGESDPNDPNSTVACSDSMPCPAGLVCIDMTCRLPIAPDSGLMCQTLEEIGVQCCMGSTCETGEPVAPICERSGDLELCPAGARRCSLDSCGGPRDAPQACSEGNENCPQSCGCSTLSPPGERNEASYLLGLMLVLATCLRRREAGRFPRPSAPPH